MDLNLAREVASQFRLSNTRSEKVISDVLKAVSLWSKTADKYKIPRNEKERMEDAFTKIK